MAAKKTIKKTARKSIRTASRPKTSQKEVEAELKKVHLQMQKSLDKLNALIKEVADDKQGKAAKHLKSFHEKQKQHLENIRKKL